MSTTTDKQFLDIQREQIRITDVLNLLKTIYKNCKNVYNKVLTADYIKEKSLPNQLTQVIADKNIVKVRGTGTGKLFLWAASRMPDELMATQVWEEAVRLRNEYNVAKERERRGETPNRLQIGNKNFVKLLTPTNDTKQSVLKKQPTTVTEVKVYRMMKTVQTFLTVGQRVMDFASLCEHKGISTKYEKALLKTYVTRTNRGFEWKGNDEVDYEMVRNVIDTYKLVDDCELDITTPIIKIDQEEPKSEFEKKIESVSTAMQVEEKTNVVDEKRKYNIFTMLQALRKDIEMTRIKGITDYCIKFNLTNNLGGVLVEEKIIEKENGAYKWIAAEPSKAMVEQINDAYNKRNRKYYGSKKQKEEPKFTKEIVQERVPRTKELLTVSAPTVLREIVNEVKNEEVARLKNLAEKFAKTGNYDMAEQLLDQVLKAK